MRPYYGICVIEIKYQDNRGDWHLHWHVYFFNRSPHKRTVSRIWNKIQGQECIVKVKYNSRMTKPQILLSKKRLLGYAAKRCALAGLVDEKYPLPTTTYLELIYNTRLYSKFGSYPAAFDEKVMSILALLATLEQEFREKWTGTIILITPKHQTDKDPPPDLMDQVIKSLQDDDRFSVKFIKKQIRGIPGTRPLFGDPKFIKCPVIKFKIEATFQTFSPELTAENGITRSRNETNTHYLTDQEAHALWNRWD